MFPFFWVGEIHDTAIPVQAAAPIKPSAPHNAGDSRRVCICLGVGMTQRLLHSAACSSTPFPMGPICRHTKPRSCRSEAMCGSFELANEDLLSLKAPLILIAKHYVCTEFSVNFHKA